MLRTESGVRGLAVLTVLFAVAAAIAADDVPPRSAGGQALVVPKEQLDLGEVYRVTPGGDTQLICQSDAPLLRTAFVCNRVVGYLVAPFDPQENQPPILAGALRIPVASLRCGIDGLDEQLHGPPMLNQAEYPEITLRLTGVSDAKLVKDENGRRSYTLKAATELLVKGKAVPLEAPLRILFAPFTWGTMSRNVGDLLIVRATFEAKMTDLGLEAPPAKLSDFGASTVTLDIFLLCSTMSSEKNLDPRIKLEQHLKQLQFLTLLRDFNDPDKAYAFGRDYVHTIWDDAQALNRVAWATLVESGIERRDLGFVSGAAQRANELTESKDPLCLYTLARLHYEKGDIDAAVKWARQAAEHADKARPEEAAEIRATLQRYEAQAEKTKS